MSTATSTIAPTIMECFGCQRGEAHSSLLIDRSPHTDMSPCTCAISLATYNFLFRLLFLIRKCLSVFVGFSHFRCY